METSKLMEYIFLGKAGTREVRVFFMILGNFSQFYAEMITAKHNVQL